MLYYSVALVIVVGYKYNIFVVAVWCAVVCPTSGFLYPAPEFLGLPLFTELLPPSVPEGLSAESSPKQEEHLLDAVSLQY